MHIKAFHIDKLKRFVKLKAFHSCIKGREAENRQFMLCGYMYIAELLFLNRFLRKYYVYITLHLSFDFIRPNFARGIYEVLNYQICKYVFQFNFMMKLSMSERFFFQYTSVTNFVS